MPYYKDLREFLAEVGRRGRLYTFKEPVNKETELMPLFRVQMRGVPEEERKILQFDDVRGINGQRFPMRVAAGVYGGASDFVAWGVGCETIREAMDRWHEGIIHPIEPVVVKDGPVHEEVHTGKELTELGLDELPSPVEEPGFSCMIRTGTPMLTKDPETGMRNLGAYNGFFRARDRIVTGAAVFHDAMAYHWPRARQRKEPLPVAIIVGSTPVIMIVASAPIPYGRHDELAVAGGIMGEPIELVKCKTVPLEVPATAEIVIEGLMSTEVTEELVPFGEYPGYMATESTYLPVIQVTAITHRKNAIFTPITVGMYPSDSNTILSYTYATMLYDHLRYGAGYPIEDIHFPDSTGGREWCLIRLKSQRGVDPWTVLHAAAGLMGGSKFIVLVDNDIDVRDRDAVMWAMSYRCRPELDVEIVHGRNPALDPSGTPPGSGHGEMVYGASLLQNHHHSRVLYNATRKWAYPPVGLPAKEYMERALALWGEHKELPQARMHEPWHGYTLGNWSAEQAEFAKLIVEGKYLQVGEITAKRQKKVTAGTVKEDIAIGR
ncbi:MAG TPA: UbiD family decarboxylase [Candidatus Binatia bacterium]